MKVCGKDIQVEGRLIRIARLAAEWYEFLEDPEPALDALRESGVRIDLFTFTQKLPHASPKYPYPMEWDNVAALPVSTFDHWWSQQINKKTGTWLGKPRREDLRSRGAFRRCSRSGDLHHLQRVPDPTGNALLALRKGP